MCIHVERPLGLIRFRVWKVQRHVLSKRNFAGYAQLKRNAPRYGEQPLFLQKACGILAGTRYMEPMRKALDTFERHREAIIARWESMLTNARLEGLNSLFQAARAHARGYRNTTTFLTMIYLIAAPIKELLFPLQNSTSNVEEAKMIIS